MGQYGANQLFRQCFCRTANTRKFTFRSSLGIDFNDYKSKDVERKVDNGFVSRNTNRLILDTNKFTSLVFSNTLNYTLELGEHRIGVLLGIESIKEDFDSVFASADDFAVETEDYFVLNAASGSRTSQGRSTGSRLSSQFGKFNYAFSNRYLASFTLRRDGSSRFGANNRYGIFPAATLGWRINNEQFMSGVEVVSNLKFRAGYGEVGNQEIGDLARFGLYEPRYGPVFSQFGSAAFDQWYNIGTAYDLNGNNSGNLPSGFVSVQAANPDLKWETTKEWNFGLDFGFLNNTINGSFDYFTRNTIDILTTPPIASAIGEGQQRVLNGASTETNGLGTLSWATPKPGKTSLPLAYPPILELLRIKLLNCLKKSGRHSPERRKTRLSAVPNFRYFGYRTDGLFQSQAEVDAHPTGGVQTGNARPGGIKIVDFNNDGVIDGSDRDFIGMTLA